PFLLLPDRCGVLGLHPGHACLTAGGQQVVHLLAGAGPGRDDGGQAVLDVVGVRGDDEGALPVVRHRGWSHGESLPLQRVRATLIAAAISGACRGRRRTAAVSGSGRRGTTRNVCTCAGRKAVSRAVAAQPPVRRVDGTASSAAVASSATPL